MICKRDDEAPKHVSLSGGEVETELDPVSKDGLLRRPGAVDPASQALGLRATLRPGPDGLIVGLV